jgi:macrolide transport system ATP-binding/permease protein
MESILMDIQYGFRRLWQRPSFTAIALITLALGIGANTAIFSLVNTALLRPLPVSHPEQLVSVYGTLHDGADFTLQSYLNYKDYRDRNQVLSGLLAYRFAPMSLSHGGSNQRVWGYLVSGNYFDVLGVPPMLGRGFLPEEDKTPDSHPVVVMGYGCWQQRFGADPNIVGKTISINGHNFTVVGVAPRGFIGTEVAFAPDLFVPMMMDHVIEVDANWLDSRADDNLFVVGRLKPGVTAAQAESAMRAITLQLAQEYPKEDEGRGVRLMTVGLFLPEIRSSILSFTAVLMGVVVLVLLLACVNLANLLLARATERRKEIATRLALGASRARLVRQLVTESLLLSLIGGAIGLMIASWINHLVAGIKLPTDIALLFDLRLDWRVLTFALFASLATGVVFSILPALHASRPELVPALKDEASMGGFRRSRLRNALVVVQVALSLVLLIGAGLIVRSLQAAQRMRPGFNPDHAVTLSFDMGLQGYSEQRGREFQNRVLEHARAIPGVRSVALAGWLPLSLNYNSTSVYLEGEAPRPISQLPQVIPYYVSPEFFRTMETPLRGRDFTEQEDKKESRVAIVNETFARKFFPNQDAIGKRFTFSGPGDPFWQVIGVVADGKYNSLGEEQQPAIFRPLLRDYNTSVALVARTTGDSQNVIRALRREMQTLDPAMPLYNVETLNEHMAVPLFPARMAAIVLGSFGVLALLLAAVGIYGVMSYVVAGRIREIGLRMALGASPRKVMKLIVGQGMFLAIIGLAIGLGLAFAGTRLLGSLLYGVSAADPLTFIGIASLLSAVAVLACFVPARRATKVDPLVALRYE